MAESNIERLRRVGFGESRPPVPAIQPVQSQPVTTPAPVPAPTTDTAPAPVPATVPEQDTSVTAPGVNWANPINWAAAAVDSLNDTVDLVGVPVQRAVGIENPVRFGGDDLLPQADEWTGHAVAEAVSGVGGIYALPTLATAAGEAVLDASGRPFFDKFSENLISDEGHALIAAANKGGVLGEIARKKYLDDPSKYLKAPIRFMHHMYDTGSELGGVTRVPGEVDLDDEVAGILGATLLTLPAGGLGAFGRLSTFASRASTTAAGRALLRTASVLGKAMEYSTPVTLTNKPLRDIPLNAATQVGINDVFRGLGGESTLLDAMMAPTDVPEEVQNDAGYAASNLMLSPDEADSVNNVLRASQTEQAIPTDEAMPTDSIMMSSQAVSGEVMPDEEEDAERSIYQQVFGDITAEDAITGGALSGGMLLGLYALRGRGMPRQGIKTADPKPAVDELGTNSFGDIGRNIEEVLSYGDRRLIDAVKKAGGADEAARYEDMLTTTTRHATDVQFRTYMDTGVVGDMHTVPGVVMDRAYIKLNRSQKAAFDRGVTARNERTAANRGEMSRRGLSVLDRDNYIKEAEADPEVNRVMDMYDRMHRDFAYERFRQGLTDQDQLHKELNSGPFMHVIDIGDNRTTFNKIWDAATMTKPAQRAGDPQLRSRAGGVPHTLNPMQAQREYARDTIESISHNKARDRFVRSILRAPSSNFPRGVRPVARGDGKRAVKEGYPLEVFMNGKKRIFMIGDRRLHNQLQFRPAMTVPVASDITRLFTSGTTGKLRPMFAPFALLYDMSLGMLSHKVNDGVAGLLDQGLRDVMRAGGISPDSLLSKGVRVGGALVTRVPDTIGLVAEGMFHNVKGLIAQEHGVHMSKKLLPEIGKDIVRNADDVREFRETLAKSHSMFLESKYGLMQRHGHAPSMLTDDMYGGDMKAWEQALQNTLRRNPISRVGIGALGAIRDAYRMGNFSRNVAAMESLQGRGLNKAELQQVARMTRTIATDPTKAGSSNFVTAAASLVPYGNIILQSTVHLAKQIRNPAAWSTVTGIVGYRMFFENQVQEAYGDEGTRFWRERVPAWQQTSFMPVPKYDDRPPGHRYTVDDFYLIPLGPELGAITAPMVTAIRGFLDIRTKHEPDTLDVAKESLGSLMGVSAPPALNLATSIGGLGPGRYGNLLDGRSPWPSDVAMGGFNEQQRGVGQDSGIMTDRIAHILYSTVGVLGNDIADAGERFDASRTHHDASFYDAANDALETFGYEFEEPFARLSGGYSLFGEAHATRDSQGTPVASKYHNFNDTVERINSKAKVWHDLYAGNAREGLQPAEPSIAVLPQYIRDTSPKGLRYQAQRVGEFYSGPMMRSSRRRIENINRQLREIRNAKKASPLATNEMHRTLNDELQGEYSVIMDDYLKFEQQMRIETGNPEWSLERFADALDTSER